jgi:hypothetical protein
MRRFADSKDSSERAGSPAHQYGGMNGLAGIAKLHQMRQLRKCHRTANNLDNAEMIDYQ